MEGLFETQRLIIEAYIKQGIYARHIYNRITLDNHITGILGGRGVGKTTLLLNQALKHGLQAGRALYVSADNIYFLKNSLLGLVDQLYKETDVRLLCVDEVHKYPNWEQELKNIADIYLEFKVLFTSSSAIDIIHSKFDLSRRVTIHRLAGLSFREYLEFFLGLELPIISFDEVLTNHIEIANTLLVDRVLKHFHTYLQVGYYPFFKRFKLDIEKFEAIENAVQKTIYEDIATLYALKTPTLAIIEKLYRYVLSTSAGELNANKLAKTLNKGFDSVTEYLDILQKSGLIRFLYSNQSGKAYLRNPIKMYPDNSNLVYASFVPQSQDSTIGNVRENFVINQIQNVKLNAYYSKVGDFEINNKLIEVGGKNKSYKQLKSVGNGVIFSDGIVVGANNKIPLYLLGFLY